MPSQPIKTRRPLGVTVLAILCFLGGLLQLWLIPGVRVDVYGPLRIGWDVAYAVLLLAFGYGAWQMRRWAWPAGLVIAATTVITGLVAIVGSDLVGGLTGVVLAAIITRYWLQQRTRDAFAAAAAQEPASTPGAARLTQSHEPVSYERRAAGGTADKAGGDTVESAPTAPVFEAGPGLEASPAVVRIALGGLIGTANGFLTVAFIFVLVGKNAEGPGATEISLAIGAAAGGLSIFSARETAGALKVNVPAAIGADAFSAATTVLAIAGALYVF